MEVKDVYRELSVSTIVALFIKSFLIILICSIAGLFVGIGYDYLHSNSEKQLEEYSSEYETYQESVSELESRISYLNNMRDVLSDRNRQNPLFAMDMNNVYKTSTGFMLVGQSGQNSEGLTSLMKSYWDSLDLSSVLNIDLSDDNIRSLIKLASNTDASALPNQSITASNSGITAVSFVLSVFNENAEVSESYSSLIISEIEDFLSDYGVEIKNKSTNTEKYQGTELINRKENYRSELSEIGTQISEVTTELKDVRKNAPSKYHTIKYSVLGFLAGGMVSFICAFIAMLSSNPILLSFDVEDRMKKPFLGAVFASSGLLARVARKVIGERSFKSGEDASKMISKNFSCLSTEIKQGDCVAILCSRRDKYTEIAADSVCRVINECGFKTVFVSDSLQNPDALEAIRDSNAVVILEEQWKSKWIQVASNIQMIENSQKPIVGFILC